MAHDGRDIDIEMERMPPSASSLSNRSKYESYDLSGSVFLIGSNGIISLPMPSRSARDPLNWSKWKRAMAFVALAWFSVVGLVLVQGASLMFEGLMAEFPPAVSPTVYFQYPYDGETCIVAGREEENVKAHRLI